MNNKQELRTKILQLRNALTPEERCEKSKRINNRVITHPKFKGADQYLLFYSFKSEVDTLEIIQQALKTGMPVYLPKVQGKEMEFYHITSTEDLKEGYKGIMEPEEKLSTKFRPLPNKKTFVLIPGVAFDKVGGRIGYGGGFYDRYLETLEKVIPSENLCKMALGFQCQVLTEGCVMRERHDIRVDYIVTEETILH